MTNEAIQDDHMVVSIWLVDMASLAMSGTASASDKMGQGNREDGILSRSEARAPCT